jgi:hypothetical protein
VDAFLLGELTLVEDRGALRPVLDQVLDRAQAWQRHSLEALDRAMRLFEGGEHISR